MTRKDSSPILKKEKISKKFETTQGETMKQADGYKFHGNAKDKRIAEAIRLLKDSDVFLKVAYSKGIYAKDARAVKRYTRAIQNSEDNTVRVTEA